jgi:FkbM family methyltransferase
MLAPSNGVKTTETRFGEMSYFVGDYYIGKSLELYGEYSWGEVELLSKVVKPGWTIVSGGANIGALTVPLAKLCDSHVKVYAFEPQPEVYRVLEINTLGMHNVSISDCALWSSCGETRMRMLRELEHPNIGGLIINDTGGSHVARSVALDVWLQGEDVDLIFLDIEGCEVEALKGARKTVERCRPVLYVEDHPGYRSNVSSYVRSLGYFVYAHRPLLFSRDNWKGHPESFFGDVASFNSLCIPKERLEEFRSVIEDQHKYFKDEGDSSKLKMVVPKSRSTSGWVGVARCGGVGDNLIAASVCRPLKEMGYKVEVITQNPQGVVFENNPYIDKLSVYEHKDWPEDISKWQDWFRMRSREYEKFANLSHSVEARHGLLPIQTWYWWPQEYRRKLCAGSYLETAHDVMGMPHTFGPLFFPTDEEKEHAHVTKRKLGEGPWIGWTLSGTRIDKVYPYASLLIGRLIKELGVQVMLMGGPPPYRDVELARGIMETVKVQNGSVAGLHLAASPSMEDQIWPIRRVLSFAATCDLMIGPDTGVSWSVAFEPVPKIICVSHTSVENITKHWINTVTLHADEKRVPCWPCHRLHDEFKTCNPIKINTGEFASCISDISVETIVNTAAKVLKGDHYG